MLKIGIKVEDIMKIDIIDVFFVIMVVGTIIFYALPTDLISCPLLNALPKSVVILLGVTALLCLRAIIFNLKFFIGIIIFTYRFNKKLKSSGG